MSDKKIKVCFETTLGKLADVMQIHRLCPGSLDTECTDETFEPRKICEDTPPGVDTDCAKCILDYIDRITVGDENREIETWKRATNYWHENWKELARFCKKNVQAEIPKSIKALIDGLEGE
jgi:hypothetical protein